MTAPTNFVTRSQWGSDFNYSSNTRMPTTGVAGVALHWEGGKMGSFAHDQCDDKVRQIERYHTNSKGWAGIAYNALVCPHGYIYEGRGLKYRSAANGDEAKNNRWFAVCFLGGKGDPFPTAAAGAYVRAVQWLRADGHAGKQVVGHRDVTATECPGSVIEGWLKTTDFSLGTVGPVPPLPELATWGQPATWHIGAMGPDVARLGTRVRVWWKALGWGDPYKVGVGEPYTETDRAALSRLQAKAWGFGAEPVDLALGGGSDGFPGAATFIKLDEAPPVVVEPEPVETVDIDVLFMPTAGYNGEGARGVTQWKANTDGLVDLVVNKVKPDMVGSTEMSNRKINPMLPRFDKGAAAYNRAPGGSDGRYWWERQYTTKHIASGHVLASNASELNDDDKQAAWDVVEVHGVRKGFIVAHTENQDGIDWTSKKDADTLRVDQSLSMLSRALKAMEPYGITADDVLYVGDFNSNRMVRDAMVELGWKAGKPGYFTRWDDSAQETFDWVFYREGSLDVEVINHRFGDHTALKINWTVNK